jgi:two-component system, LuxR family, response regulator FixJ
MDHAEGRLIFFVDDDKLILNLMEYVFQNKNGHRIRTFLTGEELLMHLHLNPDLIILDYYFPEAAQTAMNGLDIMKELKASGLNIPVIVLSGNADNTIKEEFLSMGVKEFIPKDDFFIDVLEKAISRELVQIS